jgi:hypothetical protein
MQLVLEEGDAQEIDVALYEKANQTQPAGKENLFAPGLAGVSAGLAGVYTNTLTNGVLSNGSYSPYLSLPAHKTSPLMHSTQHSDLYASKAHPLNCSCHAGSTPHQSLHSHSAQCTCQHHGHCAHSTTNGHKALADQPSSSSGISELDVGMAVQADVANSGVLPPPLITVSDTSAHITIHPLPHVNAPVLYQVQLKIKKVSSYHLSVRKNSFDFVRFVSHVSCDSICTCAE